MRQVALANSPLNSKHQVLAVRFGNNLIPSTRYGLDEKVCKFTLKARMQMNLGLFNENDGTSLNDRFNRDRQNL
jgi:hypothetical protein